MPLWMWLIDSLALLAFLGFLVVAWFVIRRRVITKGAAGTFDMSTNRNVDPGTGWTLGFAVYGDVELRWYRTFSLSPRPRYRFARGTVLIEGRRAPIGSENHAIYLGHVIVDTKNQCGVRQMAMSANALTGLLSWLESSPPGGRVNNVL
ncbi:MAG: DUF2550 domain-containing protein [Aeromicrobium sp.]|uniref:DUF2550 domain-containing protein n=1 Tax=Aeromicrobium sp. TaxID=1871063 RepID=UPI003C3ECC63